VNVAPQAADAVEILAAASIDERTAVGPLDQQWLVFGHLRESMPDVGFIPLL